jgi:metallo-beta-lactamase family protein
VPLRADVVVLNGYSAHADRNELARWLGDVRNKSPGLRTVHLVHGEPEAQDSLRDRLASAGYTVTCPEPGTRTSL